MMNKMMHKGTYMSVYVILKILTLILPGEITIYADSVSPEQPLYLCSLIWELRCPLISQRDNYFTDKRTVKRSDQTMGMHRQI